MAGALSDIVDMTCPDTMTQVSPVCVSAHVLLHAGHDVGSYAVDLPVMIKYMFDMDTQRRAVTCELSIRSCIRTRM